MDKLLIVFLLIFFIIALMIRYYSTTIIKRKTVTFDDYIKKPVLKIKLITGVEWELRRLLMSDDE